MGKKITALLALLLFTGCAEFDLHIRKGAAPVKASKILIGNFEFRNMSFDPYVAPEFREALKFEFFKRGFDAELIPEGEELSTTGNGKLKALAEKYSGDIIICGVISQRETGFLTDREIRSSVSFLVFSGAGEQIGEGYYYADVAASDEYVRRGAAGKFVKQFLGHVKAR
ncbi:MAG TPA: hypothetical protein PK358_07965 [Spirochaetota bacterium]|nr:hypothetical protein [Spirochaetota bacterium]HPJ34755.1 hypothetical protein [Spirochaetota bacterium]